MSPWQALERVHGWRATEADWKRKLGDGYEAIRPLLTNDGGFASEVLLPGERRPRRVVMHSKADVVAIDRDTDQALPVRLQDVILHSLLPERLCAELAKHFRLGKSAATRSFGLNAWRLGEFTPYEGASFPAYLVLEPSAELCCNAVKTIAGGNDSPFVAVVLHAGNACDQVIQAAAQCRAGVVVVENAMLLLNGTAPHESFHKQLEGFVRKHVRPTDPSEVGKLRFPTPPGSNWPDVKIKFHDNQTVTVTCKGVQRKLGYDHMGFTDKRNGKPNTLWSLLVLCAAEGRTLTWQTEGASEERRKQVQRLNEALHDFFLIKGAPLAYDEEIGGWRTEMDLQP